MSLRRQTFQQRSFQQVERPGVKRPSRSPEDLARSGGGTNGDRPFPPKVQKDSSSRTRSKEYQDLKTRIHDRLLDMIDLSIVDTLEPEALKGEIRKIVEKILREEENRFPLNYSEKETLHNEIINEVMGLGPLEPFLQDPGVSDIMVNGSEQIFVERKGKLELTEARFKDDDHLMKIIDRIVSAVGRRVDESSPMVDARLKDGSRVNAIIPPLALDGPSLSIRRFPQDRLEIEDLIEFKALSPEVSELLKGIVKARLNILISGGTGTGKTTMLNVLSRFIPSDERIVTIEDAAELQLKQIHVVRLETRPPNIEGRGEITQRELVRNCLRMRPDRIIVGEVRGTEALDMIQAMNTGHDGSLATIHANNPRDALMRLETMIAMAGLNVPSESLKRYIASAVDVIIQIARFSDGTRKLISFQEITGMEGEIITMQEIFHFEQTGVDSSGRIKGRFRANGVRPKLAEKLQVIGCPVPQALFDPSKFMEV